MLLLIIFQLFMILTALGVIVNGLRAIRADIQRLINVQSGPAGQ